MSRKRAGGRLFRYRSWIQLGAALGTNAHLRGFLTGRIYSGELKTACVPGLNCYSCPGAVGSCPIGAMQAVISGNKLNFSYYVFGILLLFGVLLGRLICGFLCPFGWIQQLLHKLPGRKLRVPGKIDRPADGEAAMDLPMRVIVPAFMTSELKRAFEIGFLLYIPFMLIDIVVSSTLMSMGMIMLPPAMISTPFKLLLFIVMDGWSLLFSTLVQGFR